MKNWIVRGERNSDGINKWLLEKAIAPPKSGAGWVNGGVTLTLALVKCYYPTAAFLLSMTNRFAAEGLPGLRVSSRLQRAR